jgi:hypothetical protein
MLLSFRLDSEYTKVYETFLVKINQSIKEICLSKIVLVYDQILWGLQL